MAFPSGIKEPRTNSEMLHRRKLLESENHVGEDIGDYATIIRTDYEDALVQALEDVYQDGRIESWRNFIEKHRSQWPPDFYDLMRSQDSWSWYTVYWLTCTLRRMAPRWEHAANKLKDQFGMDPSQIPAGQEFLTI